jgi:hypothetical protein
MCGAAAKHIAAPKKQKARVSPRAFVFMCSIESGFLILVKLFSRWTVVAVLAQ